MAYKWLTLNKNFDRSLGISKIRYDTSINCPLVTDGYFSESPNINTDGKPWNEPSGDVWGYASENRFSPYSSRDWFSSHYYGFTDERWSAQIHTTLVSGTINGCYGFMFAGCGSLTSAPAILATTLNSYSCSGMFSYCAKLNYIKCLATNILSSSTGGWVNGVAATGTFVKNPNMTKWTTGKDGIPTGWTIVNNS